jgi:hypothetical protein
LKRLSTEWEKFWQGIGNQNIQGTEKSKLPKKSMKKWAKELNKDFSKK